MDVAFNSTINGARCQLGDPQFVVNWGTPSLQRARYYQETLQIDLVAIACQEA